MSAKDVIARMFAQDAFSQWLGIEVLTVREGYCELQMTVREEMTNGFGTAHVMFAGSGRLCYGISVFGISAPIAAHIHEAEAGTNGPVVVTLAPPVLTAGAGTSSGCVSGIAAALLASIRNTPGNFYVNVHTGQFPAGAVRGQLF